MYFFIIDWNWKYSLLSEEKNERKLTNCEDHKVFLEKNDGFGLFRSLINGPFKYYVALFKISGWKFTKLLKLICKIFL